MLRRRRSPGDRATTSDPSGLKRLIFGDRAIEDWPPPTADGASDPWRSFVEARSALQRGATGEAEQRWREIAARGDVESRHVLQAWHFLRSIGVAPTGATAKEVLGAVAEVAVPQGHDLLAAYADGSVRYLHFSGAVAVIEERIAAVDGPAQEMLAIGRSIVAAIGPWDGPMPPLPTGHSRLTMLTPSGPHFGQGPDAALRADVPAGAFFDAATRALVAIVELGA